MEPLPTKEAMEKSYTKVQKQCDSLLMSLEKAMNLLEDKNAMTTEQIDTEKEDQELMDYYDKVLGEQCDIEQLYATFRSKLREEKEAVPPAPAPAPAPAPTTYHPTVRLTSIDPPPWNGIKADFSTWKNKFTHIMSEARILSELTQLVYLQRDGTLPSEYQSFVSDCSSIADVWARLDERVPRETIEHEIIADFRKLKPLSKRHTPDMLREFTNQISLFCRRMTDLGYLKENYTCIIRQDVYERLNHDTLHRYRSKISLQKELKQPAEEDLESLCKFLRLEATTLDIVRHLASCSQI